MIYTKKTYYYCDLAFAERGERANALVDLRKALELNPDLNTLLREIQTKIDELNHDR